MKVKNTGVQQFRGKITMEWKQLGEKQLDTVHSASLISFLWSLNIWWDIRKIKSNEAPYEVSGQFHVILSIKNNNGNNFQKGEQTIPSEFIAS